MPKREYPSPFFSHLFLKFSHSRNAAKVSHAEGTPNPDHRHQRMARARPRRRCSTGGIRATATFLALPPPPSKIPLLRAAAIVGAEDASAMLLVEGRRHSLGSPLVPVAGARHVSPEFCMAGGFCSGRRGPRRPFHRR
ncbi:hypothetical protein MTO96_016744 [Rhipicephalus appendiculatus]